MALSRDSSALDFQSTLGLWLRYDSHGKHDLAVSASVSVGVSVSVSVSVVVVVVVVVGRGGFKDALMPDGAGMLIDGDELRVRRVDERRAFICII